jgi:succinate dehydrogenase/fumarate reductase-like Fe-S protein
MSREGTVAQQILEHGLVVAGQGESGQDASADGQTLRVSIRRTPPAPEMQTFDVPYTPGMSVFNVLEKVRDSIDPSLAIPISCRIGKCDICFVRVNGKVRWSCTAAPFDGMVIEPVARYVVMKDLVVDYGRRIKEPKGTDGAASGVNDDEEES